MPRGKYPRRPLRAIMRPIADDDPRNIFTQPHFREAWLNLAAAIGRVMADEDFEEATRQQRAKQDAISAREPKGVAIPLRRRLPTANKK